MKHEILSNYEKRKDYDKNLKKNSGREIFFSLLTMNLRIRIYLIVSISMRTGK